MQNFVAIGPGCLFTKYAILLCFWGDLYVRFLGSSTRLRIFTRNTSNDVVQSKEVPFGGPDDYILYLDHKIAENPPFRGQILTGQFFATKNCFNMERL